MFPTQKLLSETNLFWQYPVITEKEFYQQNKENPKYIGFPWATVIDKGISISSIQANLTQHCQHNNYYTCCQHIRFRNLIPLFQSLGITTIYAPHTILEQNTIQGITIKPCPLYAVNLEDPNKNQLFQESSNTLIQKKRPILYSFMGGHQKDYMSDIRLNIFKMKHPENCYVKHTGEWHFNDIVYSSKQNKTNQFQYNRDHIQKTDQYNQLLLDSRYCLCPSGSGPNSIRFWEALGSGSIPILLADTLALPENIDWNHAIIRLPEDKLSLLPHVLSKITPTQETDMRRNCLDIYSKLKQNYTNTPSIKPVSTANTILHKLLESNIPFSVVRLGLGAETHITYHYALHNFIHPQFLHPSVNLNGIYSKTNDTNKFELFCQMYYKAVKESDILASFISNNNGIQAIQNHFTKLYKMPQIDYHVFEPFQLIQSGETPWTHSLQGKKVLVISPFVSSFQTQMNQGFTHFRDTSKRVFVKDQEFVWYQSYQTIAGNHIHNDWFETFSRMCQDIRSLEFDVALLSCGAYGLPLCHFIHKTLHKQAIYVGGSLQLLFGVIGHRWLERDEWKQFIEKEGCTFIRPSGDEICPNHTSIENGCYW